MKILLTSALALGVVVMLGASQGAEAAHGGAAGHGEGHVMQVHGGGGHWGHGGGHWHGHGWHHGWDHDYGWYGPGYGYYGPDYDYDYDDGGAAACVGPFCAVF